MQAVVSGRLYFSEAIGINVFPNAKCWSWLTLLEVDQGLQLLKGPRWVYAFRFDRPREGERSHLYGVIEFEEDGHLNVTSASRSIHGAPSKETSGRVASIALPASNSNGTNLWLFFASSHKLSDATVRELQRFTLLPRTDGTYFAVSNENSDLRLPVTDLTVSPVKAGDLKRYHWAGSVFDGSNGDTVILVADYLKLAKALKLSADISQREHQEFTRPEVHASKAAREEVEKRILKYTLARLVDGLNDSGLGVAQKLKSAGKGYEVWDFIKKHDERVAKLKVTENRAAQKLCDYLRSPYMDLTIWNAEICGDETMAAVVEKLNVVLGRLAESPQGLQLLADIPDHFTRLAESCHFKGPGLPTLKDGVSFVRKHSKVFVEFTTKFLPGLIVSQRMGRVFANMKAPIDSEGILEVFEASKRKLSKDFAGQVGGKEARDIIKQLALALDVAYWSLIAIDWVKKDNPDIFDHAKLVSSINGALKAFAWDPMSKLGPRADAYKAEAALAKGAKERWGAIAAEHMPMRSIAMFQAAEFGIEEGIALSKAQMAAVQSWIGKRMLKVAPIIGAACDLFGGAKEYLKAEHNDDHVAAALGMTGGVSSALAGLLSLVPATMIEGSALLTAFVPGAGVVLLGVAAAAAVYTAFFSGTDWQFFVEHCIFGKASLNGNAHKPDWAFAKYNEWDDTAAGLRHQILSAYSLLCPLSIRAYRNHVEINLGFYPGGMNLSIYYTDSVSQRRLRITVFLETGIVENDDIRHLNVSLLRSKQGRVAKVVIVADWSRSEASVSQEVEAYFLCSLPAVGKNLQLPPKAVVSREQWQFLIGESRPAWSGQVI